MNMLPLLIVALLVWGGILAFLFAVDRRVVGLERKLDDLRGRQSGAAGGPGEEVRR